MRNTAADAGQVQLLPAKDAVVKALDAATRQSAQHAVIVLRDDDKPAARERFHTPLVFSVHEAKGLEYQHVLLVDMMSGQRQAYAEVADGVQAADLEVDELDYRRASDKADKSLELYKFYVNALYVAMTRAVQTLTLVEGDTEHPLLALLGLTAGEATAQTATLPPARNGRRKPASSSCRARTSRRRPSAMPSCSTSRSRGRPGAGR